MKKSRICLAMISLLLVLVTAVHLSGCAVVEAKDLWSKVRQLKAIGAEGILVLSLDKIIP